MLINIQYKKTYKAYLNQLVVGLNENTHTHADICMCVFHMYLCAYVCVMTHFDGDSTSKQNLLSPSYTGLTVHSRKSSSITVTFNSPVLFL